MAVLNRKEVDIMAIVITNGVLYTEYKDGKGKKDKGYKRGNSIL